MDGETCSYECKEVKNCDLNVNAGPVDKQRSVRGLFWRGFSVPGVKGAKDKFGERSRSGHFSEEGEW